MERILLALVVCSDLVLLLDLSQPCCPDLSLSKEAIADAHFCHYSVSHFITALI